MFAPSSESPIYMLIASRACYVAGHGMSETSGFGNKRAKRLACMA